MASFVGINSHSIVHVSQFQSSSHLYKAVYILFASTCGTVLPACPFITADNAPGPRPGWSRFAESRAWIKLGLVSGTTRVTAEVRVHSKGSIHVLVWLASAISMKDQLVLGCLHEELHHTDQLEPVTLVGALDSGGWVGNGGTDVGPCSLAGKWALSGDHMKKFCLFSGQWWRLAIHLE